MVGKIANIVIDGIYFDINWGILMKSLLTVIAAIASLSGTVMADQIPGVTNFAKVNDF